MYATIVDGYTHFEAGRIGNTYPIVKILPTTLSIVINDGYYYAIVQESHYEIEGF